MVDAEKRFPDAEEGVENAEKIAKIENETYILIFPQRKSREFVRRRKRLRRSIWIDYCNFLHYHQHVVQFDNRHMRHSQEDPSKPNGFLFHSRFIESSSGESYGNEIHTFDIWNLHVNPLGILIRDERLGCVGHETGLFIRGFDIQGSAWIDGHLFSNDQLVEVNGCSLAGK